jgi:hypothetical protein
MRRYQEWSRYSGIWSLVSESLGLNDLHIRLSRGSTDDICGVGSARGCGQVLPADHQPIRRKHAKATPPYATCAAHLSSC